jgi:hypothetical protein
VPPPRPGTGEAALILLAEELRVDAVATGNRVRAELGDDNGLAMSGVECVEFLFKRNPGLFQPAAMHIPAPIAIDGDVV